ncbi:hypothetical protein VT52_028705 [Streptomyces malaysiense]|uniref:Uncharacterized protein n=1 Tax=Streptomyces malaysiense TaxID=1428626 RepID=A0A1J4PV72_9ACTN|nr:hypothetical protein VT52_028705 [Streptomyces malaysiense]
MSFGDRSAFGSAGSRSARARSHTRTSSIAPVKKARLSLRWPMRTPKGESRLTEPGTSAAEACAPSTDSDSFPLPRRSTAWCHRPS